MKNKTKLSVLDFPKRGGGGSAAHVVLDVDVVHALVVELVLHAGDGGVVPGDAVDARVLQPPLLHQLTADLHDQRHKLEHTPAPRHT